MPDDAFDPIQVAFIDPIRSVILVDDEFPTLGELLEGAPIDGKDIKKAKELYELARDAGWLCDIENDPNILEEFERAKHVYQSDLAIIDFNFQQHQGGRAALRLLQKFAQSPHLNLVVVYTGEEDQKLTTSKIAFCLGGGRIADEPADGAPWLDEESDDRKPTIEEIYQYLMGWPDKGKKRGYCERLSRSGVPVEKLTFARDYYCYEYMVDVTETGMDGRGDDAIVLLGSGERFHWVAQGNLFAVVLNKADVAPSEIPARLRAALIDWGPPAVRILFSRVRNELARHGFAQEESLLRDPVRHAGLIHGIRSTDSPRRIGAIQGLASRIVHETLPLRLKEISEFGARLEGFSLPEGTPLIQGLEQVRALMGLKKEDGPNIALAANEHLSCQAVVMAGGIATGMILSHDLDRGTKAYVLVVTPACDLVPGQNRKEWHKVLEPFRAVQFARLTRKVVGGDYKEIKDMAHGRRLVVRDGSEYVLLEVMDNLTRQVAIEIMFVEQDGKFNEGCIEAQAIRRENDGQMVFKPVSLKPVAQLRPEYAARFQAEAGFQQARVGVDWLNLSDPPIAQADAALAVEPEGGLAEAGG